MYDCCSSIKRIGIKEIKLDPRALPLCFLKFIQQTWLARRPRARSYSRRGRSSEKANVVSDVIIKWGKGWDGGMRWRKRREKQWPPPAFGGERERRGFPLEKERLWAKYSERSQNQPGKGLRGADGHFRGWGRHGGNEGTQGRETTSGRRGWEERGARLRTRLCPGGLSVVSPGAQTRSWVSEGLAGQWPVTTGFPGLDKSQLRRRGEHSVQSPQAAEAGHSHGAARAPTPGFLILKGLCFCLLSQPPANPQ